MTDIIITCDADLFRRAAAFSATSPVSWWLGGVHIAPCKIGGVHLTGTDGSHVASFHDRSGSCPVADGVIVRLSTDALRACRGPGRTLVVTRRPDGTGSAEIRDGDGACLSASDDVILDASFPDWRRLIRPVLGEGSDLAAALDALRAIQAEAPAAEPAYPHGGGAKAREDWAFDQAAWNAGQVASEALARIGAADASPKSFRDMASYARARVGVDRRQG